MQANLETVKRLYADFMRLDRLTGRETWSQRRFDNLHSAARLEVIERFGALNGWVQSPRDFTADRIGHVTMQRSHYRAHTWDDHSLYYRKPGRPRGHNAAVVGQPYGDVEQYREELDALARKHDLRWHVAPVPRASIHALGSTLFVVVTARDHGVQWLPDQQTKQER